MNKVKFIFTILIVHASTIVCAQRNIYHNNNSTLPDSLYIQGTITDIANGYCGIICAGGVIKVKLDKPILHYPYNYAYLVTACLSSATKKNTPIKVTASKLSVNDKECYYQNIINPFKSKTIPFYKLSEKETGTIMLKK